MSCILFAGAPNAGKTEAVRRVMDFLIRRRGFTLLELVQKPTTLHGLLGCCRGAEPAEPYC